MMNSLRLVAVLVLAACAAFADQIDYTQCRDDGTFEMEYLDIEGCSGSAQCNITGGKAYAVEFSGCYSGSVSPITNIPFSVTAGFAGFDPLLVDSGDLCQDFTEDSATSSCPAVIPQAPPGACGTWLLNVTVPGFALPPLELGLPGTVRAQAWANVKSGTPVFCVAFPIQYFVL